MAESPVRFTPYDVSYSGRVQDEFAALAAQAKVNDRDQPILAAARTIDYRLRVYPQFGEPIRDDSTGSGQEWLAIVPPLIVPYMIYEEQRIVSVVKPMRLLSRSSN